MDENNNDFYPEQQDIKSKLIVEDGDTIYNLLHVRVSNIITTITFDTYIYEKDEHIRVSEVKDLLKYPQLLNSLFVRIVKICKTKDINDWAMMFLIYCDYFDIPYDKCYRALSLTIQNNIRKWASEYILIEGKKSNRIVTLFDI
jgi:hypothetical protein